MPGSRYSRGSPRHSFASEPDTDSVGFVHTVYGAGRLLPSDSKWNSVEFDFSFGPKSSINYDSIPSRYSKTVDFNMVITNKTYFKRFSYVAVSIALLVVALILLVHFLPGKHLHIRPSDDFKLAVNQALTFFDAQKSGKYPKDSTVKFRADSGLKDGIVGGFYDSGNNMKFSFPTAYTVTLLSWSVIEYRPKYAAIGELDHVKDIIKWGSDYLLKVFVPPNATSDHAVLYSQVGSANNVSEIPNDGNCWQRPEDMNYERPVSSCDATASDLAGEIVAALSAASLVFEEDRDYSAELAVAAEKLFNIVMNVDPKRQGTYTTVPQCGGEATNFYNSTGYKDELIWAGTWLYFATGNTTYLSYATEIKRFESAQTDETNSDKEIFYWNSKLTSTAVLLSRLQYFHDPGYPYEQALEASSNMTDSLMCSYLSDQHFKRTPGGLILLNHEDKAQLQFAATASFLTKLYGDYLALLHRSRVSCSNAIFPIEVLRNFSMSQVNYILGDNPMKISYMIGFGDKFPTHVHHRSASISWDGRQYSCADGDKWFSSKDPNPNLLLGAMVGGPDNLDNFLDERGNPMFTEPSIASNAGLVAALIALHGSSNGFASSYGENSGIVKMDMFNNLYLVSTNP